MTNTFSTKTFGEKKRKKNPFERQRLSYVHFDGFFFHLTICSVNYAFIGLTKKKIEANKKVNF